MRAKNSQILIDIKFIYEHYDKGNKKLLLNIGSRVEQSKTCIFVILLKKKKQRKRELMNIQPLLLKILKIFKITSSITCAVNKGRL